MRTLTPDDDKILYAFYDLAAAPNTFDIMVFLVLAEIERRATALDAFHLYVVPGPNHGFRADADVTNLARQRYVLRNVIIGSHALMPTCSGVSLCSTREAAERLLYVENVLGSGNRLVFPPGYSVHFPLRHYHIYRLMECWFAGMDIPGLEPPEHALAVVDGWLAARCEGRTVVTVTLRESCMQPERNSNLQEWACFVSTLDPRKYAVVVLRDFEKLHEPLPDTFGGSATYPEAVVSIELRAALYRRAYLNLCVNNGPGQVLLLDPMARYLYFKVVTEAASCTTVEHHRRYHWLTPGDQMHFATPFQRLVWEDDHAEVLCREFASMRDLIDSGRYATGHATDEYRQRRRAEWIARAGAPAMP